MVFVNSDCQKDVLLSQGFYKEKQLLDRWDVQAIRQQKLTDG